jgi:hypothetical protein
LIDENHFASRGYNQFNKTPDQMKKGLLFFLLMLFGVWAYSQANEMESYYPENSLLRKRRVKSMLDTIASPAFHHYKMEFDTFGRQTSWCYVEDSGVTRFRYQRNGDTLRRYHYYTKGRMEYPTFQSETFVYDSEGSILIYRSLSRNGVQHDVGIEGRQVKFVYDNSHRLLSKLEYALRENYEEFSDTVKLADSLFTLGNAFVCHYDKIGKLVLIKQVTGELAFRRTDSFYYDPAGRLIRNVGRQQQGYSGEMLISNLISTKTIEYSKNKRTEKNVLIYFDWTIGKMKTANRQEDEYVSYPSGLKWKWYHKSGVGFHMSILDYWVYEFYE